MQGPASLTAALRVQPLLSQRAYAAQRNNSLLFAANKQPLLTPTKQNSLPASRRHFIAAERSIFRFASVGSPGSTTFEGNSPFRPDFHGDFYIERISLWPLYLDTASQMLRKFGLKAEEKLLSIRKTRRCHRSTSDAQLSLTFGRRRPLDYWRQTFCSRHLRFSMILGWWVFGSPVTAGCSCASWRGRGACTRLRGRDRSGRILAGRKVVLD